MFYNSVIDRQQKSSARNGLRRYRRTKSSLKEPLRERALSDRVTNRLKVNAGFKVLVLLEVNGENKYSVWYCQSTETFIGSQTSSMNIFVVVVMPLWNALWLYSPVELWLGCCNVSANLTENNKCRSQFFDKTSYFISHLFLTLPTYCHWNPAFLYLQSATYLAYFTETFGECTLVGTEWTHSWGVSPRRSVNMAWACLFMLSRSFGYLHEFSHSAKLNPNSGNDFAVKNLLWKSFELQNFHRVFPLGIRSCYIIMV